MTSRRSTWAWEEQNYRILNLINIARITILFSLIIFIAIASNVPAISMHSSYAPLVHNHVWLYTWCFVYGMVIFVSMVRPTWQLQQRDNYPNFSSVLDITMIILLVFLAGGVRSGFGILILPFSAAACLLSYGRFALLYGNYTAFFAIGDLTYRLYPFDGDILNQNIPLIINEFLLVAACYLVPLLTAFLAEYLAQAGDRIQRQKTALERITGLNEIVLNRVQESVIVLDSQGRIGLFNNQAKQLFPQMVVGQQSTLLRHIVHEWLKNPKQAFETTEEISHYTMHIRAIPLLQKSTEVLMLFIRTEQERQREAQQVKLTSLGLLTANLAHEIRNPLSAMRHANDLLIESDQHQQPIIARLSGVIEKNIARIDKMIEDVSALNKRDRTNIKDIDLTAFWHHFLQEFELTRPESAGCIKIEMNQPNLVGQFDPMHLQQIAWNLCNNAWRHCKKRSRSIVVRNYVTGEKICISIKDDGGGVETSLLSHLFEPFQTNQADGTGLGLYVARELAHANRGDLQYNTAEKSFELMLPRKNTSRKSHE